MQASKKLCRADWNLGGRRAVTVMCETREEANTKIQKTQPTQLPTTNPQQSCNNHVRISQLFSPQQSSTVLHVLWPLRRPLPSLQLRRGRIWQRLHFQKPTAATTESNTIGAATSIFRPRLRITHHESICCSHVASKRGACSRRCPQ